MVRQLDNGPAVSSTGRRVRQPLRGTCTHARASTRARAPTVHIPTHISTALHKHDHCTFLHVHADMSTSQWRERARRALLGTARLGAADFWPSRAAAGPTTTSTSCCWALCSCYAKCWLGRQQATVVDPGGARQLVYVLIAADAGAQIASRRERGARASGINGSCTVPFG